MPVDSNIALGYRQPQFNDPLARAASILSLQHAVNQNALAQYTLSRAKRDDEIQNALAAAYRGAVTPEGGIDYGKLTGALAGGAAATSIPSVLKSRNEQEKTTADLDKVKIENFRTKLGILGGAIAPLAQNPTRAAVMETLAALKAQGIDPAPIPLPANDADLLRWIGAQAAATEHGLKALEAYQPKAQVAGDRFVNTNPMAGQVGAAIPGAPAVGMTQAQAGEAANRPFAASGAPNLEVQKFLLKRAKAGASNVTVDTKQENAFAAKLGEGQAKALMEGKAAADDAKEIINTVANGRKLLNSGMVTGFGADALVGIGQALSQAGITFAEDATANSQAYAANMAQNVGKIIKLFGAGTGLSNADREYAEKMAGGKISLDKKAIEKILDINEKMARNVIKQHNKNAAGIKTNIPLTVDEPATEVKLTPAEQSELEALRKKYRK